MRAFPFAPPLGVRELDSKMHLISLTGYAIATDALSCRDYQSLSKKTHTSLEIIRKIAADKS